MTHTRPAWLWITITAMLCATVLLFGYFLWPGHYIYEFNGRLRIDRVTGTVWEFRTTGWTDIVKEAAQEAIPHPVPHAEAPALIPHPASHPEAPALIPHEANAAPMLIPHKLEKP